MEVVNILSFDYRVSGFNLCSIFLTMDTFLIWLNRWIQQKSIHLKLRTKMWNYIKKKQGKKWTWNTKPELFELFQDIYFVIIQNNYLFLFNEWFKIFWLFFEKQCFQFKEYPIGIFLNTLNDPELFHNENFRMFMRPLSFSTFIEQRKKTISICWFIFPNMESIVKILKKILFQYLIYRKTYKSRKSVTKKVATCR